MSLGVQIRMEVIIYTSLGQMSLSRPKMGCDLIPGPRALQVQVGVALSLPFSPYLRNCLGNRPGGSGGQLRPALPAHPASGPPGADCPELSDSCGPIFDRSGNGLACSPVEAGIELAPTLGEP